jgi:hypothetical protein
MTEVTLERPTESDERNAAAGRAREGSPWTGLIAGSILLFTLACVLFQRQEIRA